MGVIFVDEHTDDRFPYRKRLNHISLNAGALSSGCIAKPEQKITCICYLQRGKTSVHFLLWHRN